PAHLRSLQVLDEGALPSGLQVFSSGAPLPADTAEMLAARFGLATREVFGSTETGGIGHRLSPPGGAWTPLPRVTVSCDADGRLMLDSPFVHPSEPTPRPCADRIAVEPDGRFSHLGRT